MWQELLFEISSIATKPRMAEDGNVFQEETNVSCVVEVDDNAHEAYLRLETDNEALIKVLHEENNLLIYTAIRDY